jgi:hypothetical protein
MTTALVDEPATTEPAAAVAPVGPLRRLQLTEPVRLALYPVLVALLALAVAYGLVSDDVAPLWEALAAAVLGVGGLQGVELLRGAVYSQRSAVRATLDAHRAGVADERERGLTITTRAAARQLTERFPL